MANSSCLGIYIDEHVIKYAKVSKDRDNIKVDSFGIKFYDKIGPAIEQVVQETYSQKTPISVNLSEEMYTYFEMFALLTKNDLQKAIKTEFESYCVDKDYNPNAFESRYAVATIPNEKDKLKVIHVADNKIELNKRIQQIEGYKLTNISPTSMCISSLIGEQTNENCLIVNIEEKTTVTTIINEQIYNVDTIEEGSQTFLSKINIKENSLSKSYEICKNTTIYTSAGRELQGEQSTYLEDIMPTLYNIVGEVQRIINSSEEKISKVYITGIAALINNVDLYFQDYLSEVTCEILRPYFIRNTGDITIKDYIEVNSAISLGMMGLGVGVSGMNFKSLSLSDRIPDWLKVEVGSGSGKSPKSNKRIQDFVSWDLGKALDKTEFALVRTAISLFLLVVIYSVFSIMINNQINHKLDEAEQSIAKTNSQIKLAKNDDEKIKTKTNEYSTMIKNLEEANEIITDRNRSRNAIPNLLNQIMSVIPENVQLTSIENTENKHVVINAQSNKYEQLGYLKAKIKSDVILTNVISTAGTKDGGVVTVTIEGDLP